MDKWRIWNVNDLGSILWRLLVAPFVIYLALVVTPPLPNTIREKEKLGTGATSAAQQGQQSSQNLPPDVLYHVTSAQTDYWVIRGGQYESGGKLQRYQNVLISGTSFDPDFYFIKLADNSRGLINKSNVALGDGRRARAEECQKTAGQLAVNNEILYQAAHGSHRVEIKNHGDIDAVVKFSDRSGAMQVMIYVSAQSSAVVEDFPDGYYRLIYARGNDWSRGCGVFLRNMKAQRFPDFDEFKRDIQRTVVDGFYRDVSFSTSMTYTITPVPRGNVRAEDIPESAF